MLAPVLVALSLSAAPGGPFEVSPYLHVRSFEGLHVGWSYAEGKAPPEAKGDLVVEFTTSNPLRGFQVRARNDDGVWVAQVPWRCDLPDGASYQVPGMASKKALPDLACPRETGAARIGFLTDTQFDTDHAARAAQVLAKQNLDVAIHGGDMVSWGGEDESWPELFNELEPLTETAPLMVAVGNHDFFRDGDGRNVGRYFGATPPRSWYRHQVGPVLFIVIDSTHIDDENHVREQQEFIDKSLEMEAPWKVVVFHHALWSKGIAHAPWLSDLNPHHYLIRDRHLVDFEKKGVDLVLNGHTHLFERSRRHGVEYVVGGPAGGPLGLYGGENPFSLRSEQRRSVSVLEADEHRLEVASYDLDGELIDKFELLHKRAPLPAPVAATHSIGAFPRYVKP